MIHLRTGTHPKALNPITSAKISKQTVCASSLYGCELWNLSQKEIYMLERDQNFIVKSVQGFDLKPRTDMANRLLG